MMAKENACSADTIAGIQNAASPLPEASTRCAKHLGCGSHPGPRWYCLHTHHGAENLVVRELCNQGFEHHLPMWVDRAGKSPIPRPLFPGYLFVSFDRNADRWRPIASTYGVRRLFSLNADTPTPIPFGVVENLIDRGLIDEYDPAPWLDPLRQGQSVRILAGPFGSLDGICLWSTRDRVKLLLNLFEIEVSRDNVEAIA